MSLHQFRQSLNKHLAQHARVSDQIATEEDILSRSQEHLQDVITAQKLLQAAAEQVQASAHQQIASVVSRCLESVFETPYQFKINFVQKRGKTEAELVFVRDGQDIDPVDAAGGGVIDLAAFSLRLACLLIQQPRRRRCLILDEPFSHLSSDHIPAVREMLLELARELDWQFLIVTHSTLLRVGKVIEL